MVGIVYRRNSLVLCMVPIILCAFFIFLIMNTAYAETINVPALTCSASVTEDSKGVEHIDAPGFDTNISSGDPALPYKEFSIILPPKARVEDIALEGAEFVEVEGSHDIAPAPPVVTYVDGEYIYDWGTGKDIADGKNQAVYNKDEYYPKKHVEVVSVGQMRKWYLARVRFYPYRYNPKTGKLIRAEGGIISTACAAPVQMGAMADQTASAESQDTVLDSIIEKQASQNDIVNYDQAKSWYTGGGGMMSAMGGAESGGGSGGYYILTTSDIVNNSTKLQDFVDHKTGMGFSVTVVTESAWDSLTGDAGANKIREYLQANYISAEIKYVLLIGNSHPSNGDVPMKKLWPRSTATSYRDAPSDYFYADLTGNWDLDGDGLYGEYQDFGDGGIDRNPEVLVGRIPFYGNFTDLDSILQKIIDYESGNITSGWVGKVLLSMEPSDGSTPGWHLGEAIKNNAASPAGFYSVRVYEQTYGLDPPPEKTPCNYDNVLAAWQEYAGFHIWWTHGSTTLAADIFSSSRCQYLDDDYPSFTFQVSCYNGYPENSSNLGYSLLKQGAIGTVSATRVSWYYPGQTVFTNSTSNAGMSYHYAINLIREHMPCGEALFTMFSGLSRGIWMNHLVFVLYGDPSVSYYADSGDLTPPTTPEVADDGDFTYLPGTLSADWSSYDPDSGIVEYEYKITKVSIDGTVVIDWTSTGLDNYVTAEGLTLEDQEAYYFSIKAKNGVGLWSAVGYSDGIVYNIDTTPPTLPEITNVNYYEIGQASGRTVVYANYSASDPETGVAEYQYKITKDSPDGQVLKDWTSTGVNTYFNSPELNLTDGADYYLGIKARNLMNLWSDIAYQSFLYIFDITHPVVTITTPKQGNICVKDFTIEGTASDNRADITSVDILISSQGGSVGGFQQQWTCPVIDGAYSQPAIDVPDGAYYLNVSARDDRNNYISDQVNIVVINTQPVSESFEDEEWGGWQADNDGKAPEFIIERSQAQAYDGISSIRVFIDGSQDDGTGWIERTINFASNSMYQMDMGFQVWSEFQSPVNNWGVVAYAGINDPEVEEDFVLIGDTDQVAGWKEYTYQTQIRTDYSGNIYIACGITVYWETPRSYYIDLVNITFTQVPNGSVSGTVVDDIDVLQVEGADLVAYDWTTKAFLKNFRHTPSDGSYVLDDLPPGKYRIHCYDGKGGLFGSRFVSEYYDDAVDEEHATAVVVVSGQETLGIDFDLSFYKTVMCDLYLDYNQIGFSVAPSFETSYKASKLIQELAGRNICLDIVMQWDGAAWISHQDGLPFTDFDLDLDRGIFVNATECGVVPPFEWDMYGIRIKLPKSVNLYTGWNLVAIPETIGVTTAIGILGQINSQGGTADVMMWWDGAVWISTQAGLPFTDQVIVPGRSYFIRCAADSAWMME